MLVQQLAVLSDITVIEIGNPEVEKYAEKERKIQDAEVETEILRSDSILNRAVNPENPERLDQKVKKQQQSQVFQEFFLHSFVLIYFCKYPNIIFNAGADHNMLYF
jgi:hypothetical protein